MKELTVDKKVMGKLLKVLGITNLECAYCGKELKAEEIGGLWNDKGEPKLFCNDEVCIIQYLLETEHEKL